MQSTLRRAPHAFNMLRQIRVLQKCSRGKTSVDSHFEATWLLSFHLLSLRIVCKAPESQQPRIGTTKVRFAAPSTSAGQRRGRWPNCTVECCLRSGMALRSACGNMGCGTSSTMTFWQRSALAVGFALPEPEWRRGALSYPMVQATMMLWQLVQNCLVFGVWPSEWNCGTANS